jgi:hypothetical protein
MTARDSEDVAEACADALLAAAAHVLIMQRYARQYNPEADPTPPAATPAGTEQVSIYEARDLAVNMLDRVIVRTIAEGGRPR